jgi:hypothetical protein
MRPNDVRRFALSFAAASILTFPVPQWAAAQELHSSQPQEDHNLETSARGPLQKRLGATFPDSFREGVDVFLEADEDWVSPEIFDWWAFRVDPAGLTYEAAERMFSRLSGREPIFSPTGHDTSCAVVGASRNLLGSRYGPLIDAHDVVFRVNRAPTEDFVADVGKKTTHHVAWPTDLGENQADRRAYLLFNPMTLHSPNLFDRLLSLVEYDLGWDPSKVRIIHPGFVMYLHQNWMEARRGFPSTGLIALMIAMHVCDEVRVFGFGADAQGRWDRYYEDDPAARTDLHSVDYEGEFRRDLAERGLVHVFLGNRSAEGIPLPGYDHNGLKGD